jgi:uncharacterized damage-inducible protein DinB
MARYNQWANRDLFAAVRALPESEVAKHRRSLFKNILNTLNHPLVADRMWWAHMYKEPPRQLAAHKHPKVIAWLARHQRVTFHFTPTSAS